MNIRDQLERYGTASKLVAPRPRETAPVTSRAECDHTVTVFPSHHRHGSFELSSFGGVFRNASQLLVRGDAGKHVDFARVAFIDTETTGLSGGSGVCAFLVGIGYLAPEGFVVEQFLMNDFPAEPDMLRKVCEKLEGFDLLASYNGRSFDIPILDTRLLLNRIELGVRSTHLTRPTTADDEYFVKCVDLTPKLSDMPHMDLLHPARRLWKHRLSDCSLKSVETHALEHVRDNDIEGWMIPETFFRYLRSGERDLLEPIVRHNRLDIVSLACISRLILGAVETPHEASLNHGPDWYGLGTLFAHYQRTEAALCFERALATGLPEGLRRRCMTSLALTHKKKGAWDNAVELWKDSLTDGEDTGDFLALEELAKFYEHRQRDLAAAREVCHRAMSMLEIKEAIGNTDLTKQFGDFEYRLKRIEKKIQNRKT